MLLFWYDSGIILAGLHMFSKTLNKMEPLSLPTLELLAKYQNKGEALGLATLELLAKGPRFRSFQVTWIQTCKQVLCGRGCRVWKGTGSQVHAISRKEARADSVL